MITDKLMIGLLSFQSWHSPRPGEACVHRKSAWFTRGDCSCTYGYGKTVLSPHACPPVLLEATQAVMERVGIPGSSWPDSCHASLYLNGKAHVGWHADDEDLFEGRDNPIRIVSLSLGASRIFQ